MTVQIPYLSDEAIERDAEALLAEYAFVRRITIRPPIPIEDIIEKHLKLRVEFDDLHEVLDVPKSGPEPEIFGAIWFDRREIFIDQSLDPEEWPEMEGRYRFTLAHEGGGHWRLHRVYFARDPAQQSLLDGASKPAVVCRSSKAKERIEWQADFHASCLLMPRALVVGTWRERFGSTEPIIYETMRERVKIDPPRWRTFRRLDEVVRGTEYDDFMDGWASIFAPIFRVSPQAMRIRLEKLGLLRRDLPRQRSFAVRG